VLPVEVDRFLTALRNAIVLALTNYSDDIYLLALYLTCLDANATHSIRTKRRDNKLDKIPIVNRHSGRAGIN